MPTKETITIIGAGSWQIVAMAKRFAATGNALLLFSNNENEAAAAQQQLQQGFPPASVETLNCPVTASWEADIIISLLTSVEEKELANKIGEVANQKIVISFADPSGNLADLLPHSKVVYARREKERQPGEQKDHFIFNSADADAVKTASELFSEQENK
ncbi:MAG: oxidoreductase coenzyme F420-dependent [Ferruginibacter sp.]|nr:oxidoreductase coenzyme F420-dependent [Ferruginibacter sp.]